MLKLHFRLDSLSPLQRQLIELVTHLALESAVIIALVAMLCFGNWLLGLLTSNLENSTTRFMIVVLIHGVHEVPVWAAAINTLLISLWSTAIRILSIWKSL